MTTIVYDHKKKQIACDSLTTADDIVMSAQAKKFRNMPDGSIWFFCGSVADIDAFVHCMQSGEKTNQTLSCNAFIVRDGTVYISGIDNGEPWKQKLDLSRAIGSGHQFAMAAIDFGKSAHDAVKYAATRDIYTGGKIRVYDIAAGRFIK
jgi:ATP-dependent protease HslVU (ClpYQ) peptidase subunit